MPVNASSLMYVKNGDKISQSVAQIPCPVQQTPTMKNVEQGVTTLVTPQTVMQPLQQAVTVMMEWWVFK